MSFKKSEKIVFFVQKGNARTLPTDAFLKLYRQCKYACGHTLTMKKSLLQLKADQFRGGLNPVIFSPVVAE
jgi:hypothetical protein